MANALRKLVSKKKNRTIEDGFNLDLTYINGEYSSRDKISVLDSFRRSQKII